MPVVLAWIGAWIMEEAVALGASYAAAAIIGTAAEYAIVIGGSLAYSNYQKKRMAAAGAAGTPQMIQDSTYPRNLVYGKTRVSGTLAFISTTGTKNEYLHLILPLAGCLLTSIDTIYFGSDQVTLDGSGNFTGCIDNNGVSSSKYSGLGLVHKYLGTSSQAADATLIAASGGLWTSAHQLKGVAYLYVQLSTVANALGV